MSEVRLRTFSRAFKLKAIERMDAGENVSALSRELGVKREILYRWRSRISPRISRHDTYSPVCADALNENSCRALPASWSLACRTM